jgi:hypothetical protein
MRLQRHFVLPLLSLEIAAYFAYALQVPSHIPGVAFGLLHGVALIADFLICYRTMIAEEKNRAMMFIRALPVSSSDIVIAKFGANFLLVGLNTGVLLALWGVAHAMGWLQVEPRLTIHLVRAGLTYHWLNNAFFVTISLVFSSEGALWVPFPALFVLISVILNFRRIEAALNLQSLVEALLHHDMAFLALLWAVMGALMVTCSWALRRKRVFA